MAKNLNAVPVMRTGSFVDSQGKKLTIDISDLDNLVRNTNTLMNLKLIEPRVMLGHDVYQNVAKILGFKEIDGFPALGHLKKIYRIGNEVFSDLADIPEKLFEMIEERKYTDVSPEVDIAFSHPETKENIGWVIKALSFLGIDFPAMAGLGNIVAFANPHDEKNENIHILKFSDKNLEEANALMKQWTLLEVEKISPLAKEKVLKFMEEKKVDTISNEDLLKILNEIKSLLSSDQEMDMKDKGKMDEMMMKEISKLALPGGEPKGWGKESFQKAFETLGGSFDDCMVAVGDKVSDAGAFCSWMKNRATGQTPGSPEWKASEEKAKSDKESVLNVQKLNDEILKLSEQKNNLQIRLREREEKIMAQEKEQREKKVAEIMKFCEEHRDILLPKFDGHIKALLSQDSVLKFSEKDTDSNDVVFDFLKQLVESKPLMFGEIKGHKELSKPTDDGLHKFAERENVVIENDDLDSLAKQIQQTEKISYVEALKKASLQIEKK